MKPEQIHEIIGKLPAMTLRQGTEMYDFILKHRLEQCLELGFLHGVSSLYIAGAIQDLGSGRLTTVDLERSRDLKPNILELLEKARLGGYVRPYFENISYAWRLMKFLESGMRECFDFCYLDASHDWQSTGFGFFLISKLLKPGGWIVLDDLHWTFGSSKALKDSVRHMPDEFKTVPQVGRVFELLVKTDPAFDLTYQVGDWGYARKRGTGAA